MPPIIVTGCHHSGTTMLVAILGFLGVNIGQAYVQQDRTRGTEYFYRTRLEIPVDASEPELALGAVFPERTTPWAFKLLDIPEDHPYIITLFPEARVLLIYRESVSRQHPEDDWVTMQKKYSEEIKLFAGIQLFCANYDRLVSNPNSEIANIVQFLGITPTEEQLALAVQFVTSEGMTKDEIDIRLWQQ